MNQFKNLLLLSFLALAATLSAQSQKAYQRAIDEAVANQEFTKALNSYKVMLDDADRGDTKMYYDAAQTARTYRVYDMAERYYWEVVKSEQATEYPLANYWLGMVQKSLGKYSAADSSFQRYLSITTSADDEFATKAQKEIDDCAWAQQLKVQDIDLQHEDSTINTSCHTEVAPFYHDGQLYFSSVRYEEKEGVTSDEPVNQIFSAAEGMAAVRLTDGFNKTGINTGHTAFSPDGTRMFYTICEGPPAGSHRCHIYYKEKDSNGNWGEEVKLSEKINLESYTSTQPNIGVDKEGNELLFYSSDRPEGLGGMDIWCSIRDDNGEYGTPFNIQAANTEMDDLTPFYYGTTNTLYFSSNGRQNMGGFDVYKIRKTNKVWGDAKHMGAPVNSSYDDVYYTVSDETDKGYFSSNRPATVCSDYPVGRSVCNDIYTYEIPKIDLLALTFNEISGAKLSECEITLLDLTTGDRYPVSTLTSNRAEYILDFDHEYQVIAHKDLYRGDTTKLFNTIGLRRNASLEKKLELLPFIDLTTLTYNAHDSSDLNGCIVELFNVTLNKKDSVQLIEGINKYHYPLLPGFVYRITASKTGYSTATAEVNTKGVSTPKSYTRELYLERSFKDKPVTLFFDNDYPDPRTTRTTATVDYKKTFKDYMEKQGEFESALSSDPEELEKIKIFFKDSVQTGFDNLKIFTAGLLRYLQRDDATKVKIILQGYASPLSVPTYNQYLTERRADCVEKYFAAYNKGILQYYMRPDVGRLTIELDPNGEDKATGGSDDYKDKINSIYKVAASRERRVRIIRVNIEGI